MTASAPSPGHRPASLTVINPSGHRTRVQVNESPFLIGRQSDNHLVLRDNRVSRVHARLQNEDGNWFIEDLNSRHGLFVNGRKVTREKLENSDLIGFGFPDSYQLVFTIEEAEIARLMDAVTSSSSRAITSAGGNLAKLRALVEVARALQSSLSTREVLEAVVDAALTVTGAQRGFLLMKDGGQLDVRVARDFKGAALTKADLRVPMRLIDRALNQRRELLSMHFDPLLEGATQADVSVANLELRSVVCVPLVRVRTEVKQETIHAPLNETVGLIYLDSRADVADLSAGNRELLQTLALEASTVLENARLLEEERAKQRIEEELSIARFIQQSLLPKRLPSTGWFRAAASSLPTHQVGGDYYDVVESSPGVWSTVVADVSGKGVSSALLAAFLQGAFLLGSQGQHEMLAMLDRLNRFLYDRTMGEKYATLFCAAVESNGVMNWSNAGHCPPVLLHAGGGTSRLESTSMPVGMLDFATFEVRRTQLLPGDKVIIFSDGFSEARNEDGKFFDMAALGPLLAEKASLSAAELHGSLLNAHHHFTGGAEQHDDVTLVVIEYAP